MAEEAAQTLGGLDLASLSEPVLNKVYKDLAKRLHPDVGGDMRQFIEMDKAKCILALWLKRPQATPVDTSISSDKCLQCNGTGRRTLRRGFSSMTMVCGSCRGSGEHVAPEKVEE